MEIGGGGEHSEYVLPRRFGRHIVLDFHFVYSNSDSVGHSSLPSFSVKVLAWIGRSRDEQLGIKMVDFPGGVNSYAR